MTPPILFTELPTASGHKFGVATLSAGQSLNALSLEMIESLTPMLVQWAEEGTIAGVILNGAGDKAFCAGGDIRRLYESIKQAESGLNQYAETFFNKEYRLDYLIHTYPKPIMVWGNGIVMGGGIGLMAGASHRVVTEASRLAMPEITIGFYPDVGASWFLRRMPGKAGLFLALTGAPLNAADAIYCKLADVAIPHSEYDRVIDALTSARWEDDADANRLTLSSILNSISASHLEKFEFSASKVRQNLDVINALIGGTDDLSEVAERLSSYSGEDTWLAKSIGSFRKGSPTSAAISFEIWQRSAGLSLADAFRLEYNVSLGCCAHPDFPEGVRALMIDKDRNPQWSPASLDQVTPEWIAEHFINRYEGSHPLADL